MEVTSGSTSFRGLDFVGDSDSAWGRVLRRLAWRWFWQGADSEEHYFGMIDETVPHNATIGTGYRASRRRHAAAGMVRPGDDWGGRTMAHEVAHNLTRRHAPCGSPANVDPDYPVPGAFLDAYGIDLANPATPRYVDPNSTYDIMSYCDPVWLSLYTYNHLEDWFRTSASVQRASAGAGEGEYLVAMGVIANDRVRTEDPFYRVMLPTGTDDEQGQGEYALELRNAQGQALFVRHFDVAQTIAMTSAGSVSGTEGVFQEIVPWQSGTTRVVIRHGPQEIFSAKVSAGVPQVTLLSPNGGEHWPPYSEQTITWTASDSDGDPLYYTVLYSPDNGTTWSAIATNITATTTTVDVAALPGGDAARIRVVASDGVNTARDDSDRAFSVEGKPPEAMIISPAAGTVVAPGAPLRLEGAATDLEDGFITDDTRFRWTSSVIGELGVGRQLTLDDLPPGWHTLTLAVTDSDGFTVAASVDVLVGQRQYLPVVLQK